VAYCEFNASPELADVVACTWDRTVPALAAPAAQRVVPDACVDFVWHSSRLRVAGPDTSAFMSPVTPGGAVVGLRLRPGVAGSVLGLPASELRNARIALEDIWGRTGAELADRLGCATSSLERRRLLEAAVRARRPAMDEPDRLVLAAGRMLGLPGSRVALVSRALATSERQLLRRLRASVGYGPKTLDRVLRFQRFLSGAPRVARGEDSLARLAAELGYADQAHLSRESVALSGLTPGELAASWAVPAAD
jgi:AraC-like DNA-binding protein